MIYSFSAVDCLLCLTVLEYDNYVQKSSLSEITHQARHGISQAKSLNILVKNTVCYGITVDGKHISVPSQKTFGLQSNLS